MSLSRREFLHVLTLAGAAGLLPGSVFANRKAPSDLYEVPSYGNVRLLHITDTHAQLLPVYYREPNLNLGLGTMLGKPPHLVGDALLKQFMQCRQFFLSHSNHIITAALEGKTKFARKRIPHRVAKHIQLRFQCAGFGVITGMHNG